MESEKVTDDGQHHSDDPHLEKEKLIEIRDEVSNVSKIYKSRTPEEINKDRTFTREILIDSFYTLRKACDKLFMLAGELINQKTDTTTNNEDVDKGTNEGSAISKDEVLNLLQTMIPQIVSATVDSLQNEKQITPDNESANPISQNNKEPPQKHVIIVESDMDNPDEVINEAKWSNVVKGSVGGCLQDVPVKNSVFTKDGKACVFLPNREAQERAKVALEGKYKVVSSTVNQKQLLPKMKICDIDTARYKKDCTKKFNNAILQKNQQFRMMVEKDKLTFEVVFIHEIEDYAIVKMSPQIRQHIIKNGRRLYLDLSTHHVKDQFHLTQCFACQQFGHKNGSPYCKSKEVETCLYCAKDHRSKNCPTKKDPSQHKCANCLKSPSYSSKACGHTSTSQECPIVIRETRILINKTAGMDAKNYYPQRTQTIRGRS